MLALSPVPLEGHGVRLEPLAPIDRVQIGYTWYAQRCSAAT